MYAKGVSQLQSDKVIIPTDFHKKLYDGGNEEDIIKEIIQLAEKANGYVRILCNEMNIVIFRQCHTHWKDLLRNIIYEEIDKHSDKNKMGLLVMIKKDIIRKVLRSERSEPSVTRPSATV